MSDSTSQKRLPTFLTVCFPNNTKEEESFLKNAHISQSIKWLNVSFDLNEAPTSLLLIFREHKGGDKSFNGFCQEAGLFMVPRGPRHFYLTEPSGAVELGSRMKSVILHEDWRGKEEDAVCTQSPPPPRKASSVLASCMHILWAFSVDSTGSTGYDSGVIAVQTFSFCFSAFQWCNIFFETLQHRGSHFCDSWNPSLPMFFLVT